MVRKIVCFGLYIDKTCFFDVFFDSPLNTELWHVPLVSVLTGFQRVPMYMQPRGAWGIATNTLEFFKYKCEALFKW